MAVIINGTTGVSAVQDGVIVEADLSATFYEQGTWLPTIEGSTAVGVGTYTLQQGWYYRIGKLVTISGLMQTSAHTGTGNIKITNLPIPVTAVASKSFIGSVSVTGLTFTSPTLSLYCTSNAQYLTLLQVASNAAATAIPIDSVSSVYFQITYLTD